MIPGEGIGGVTVTIANRQQLRRHGCFRRIFRAGCRAAEITTSLSAAVLFRANQESVSVVNGQNVKADYVVTGSATPTPTPSPTGRRNWPTFQRAPLSDVANC